MQLCLSEPTGQLLSGGYNCQDGQLKHSYITDTMLLNSKNSTALGSLLMCTEVYRPGGVKPHGVPHHQLFCIKSALNYIILAHSFENSYTRMAGTKSDPRGGSIWQRKKLVSMHDEITAKKLYSCLWLHCCHTDELRENWSGQKWVCMSVLGTQFSKYLQ